jgi:hypothetical protein
LSFIGRIDRYERKREVLDVSRLSLLLWALVACKSAPAPATTPATTRLAVQVLDPDGRLPSECLATLWRRVEVGRKETSSQQTGPCPGGDIWWTGLEPGDYQLLVTVPGATALERDVTLGVGAQVELGEARLAEGAGVGGRVRVGGAPTPRVLVQIGDRRTLTGRDGGFLIPGLPLGDHTVTASLDGVEVSAPVEVIRWQLAEVELAIEAAAPVGVIGVKFAPEPGGLRIRAVTPGGPADGALQMGDLLVVIDGRALEGLPEADLFDAMRGPPGASSAMRVRRGEGMVDVSVTRINR